MRATTSHAGRKRAEGPLSLVTLASLTLTLAGCHSAFVQASVENHSGVAVRLLEVDYPTASFGTGELADGATFRYRFKILGTGAARVQWTDPSLHDHTAQGPELQEGQEGTLTISLQHDGAHWDTKLHPVR